MPTSYPIYKDSVRNWVLQNIPLDTLILDVGAGCGTYSDLLSGYGYKMDAVEVWRPYIDKYKLWDKYYIVYNENILKMSFDTLDAYDFFILGDVLEHLHVEEAQTFLNFLKSKDKQYIIAVPYVMEQGEYEGNQHETHLQPDLTPDIMKQRYPDLELLYGNNFYGYYINKKIKHEKAFVLYADDSYLDLVDTCCRSIRNNSNIPIYVYMLNSKSNINVENTQTIEWQCDTINLKKRKEYIDREDKQIYKLLIERPKIVAHALNHYATTVAYIDTDSVATEYVDTIFDYFKADSAHPYFVEGIYDYLHLNGRGGAETREDMSTTLEHPICELFNINQYVRQRYRQTGYFVAGHNCIDWLDEWAWMCNNPKVINNHTWYAPFHEETIANALLWKYNQLDGLPYIYINGIENEFEFKGYDYQLKDWTRIPESKERLLFYHGEKNIEKLNKFINENTISSTTP